SSLNPSPVFVGGPAFTLTINGSGFVSLSTVSWSGSARTTTFVSSSVLKAAILPSDIAATATASVRVTNPLPPVNAFTSANNNANSPSPTVDTLSPASVLVGGSQFTLTVTGTGFIANSVVRWNNSDRTTAFVSATQLTGVITAADIAVAGTNNVGVFNPAPAGG